MTKVRFYAAVALASMTLISMNDAWLGTADHLIPSPQRAREDIYLEEVQSRLKTGDTFILLGKSSFGSRDEAFQPCYELQELLKVGPTGGQKSL